MSTSQRVSRGFQISPIVLIAAVALIGCSDTHADYSACEVKAYNLFHAGIWKSDEALAYVRLCMISAGYSVTPACSDITEAGGRPLSYTALLPQCFERPWWNAWRRVSS
jgi:hypothetical protein